MFVTRAYLSPIYPILALGMGVLLYKFAANVWKHDGERLKYYAKYLPIPVILTIVAFFLEWALSFR